MTLLKQLLVFLVAIFTYIAGQYFRGEWFLNTPLDTVCHPYVENSKIYCHSLYLGTGISLIAAGTIFAIVGAILLFANERGMRKWLKFSLCFVPIAIIVDIYFVPSSPLGLLDAGPGDRVNTVWNLGYLYIFVTAAIVLATRYASWRKWRAQKVG